MPTAALTISPLSSFSSLPGPADPRTARPQARAAAWPGIGPWCRRASREAELEARAARAGEDRHDARLLAAMAGGDEAALAALFDRHAPRVLGLARRLVGPAGEADEVLQEVFLQAWREAARFDPARATARGWLLLLARSRCLDRIRSGASRRRREEAAGLERGSVEPPAAGTRLEHDERAREVTRALRRLPVEQREAIELAFFEGLTHTQIADRLGAPLGTVKSRILLGMRKLKEMLAPLAC